MSRFVIIGNPEGRRVWLFQQALSGFGLPSADIVAYDDLLAGRRNVADALRPGTIVRVESPGQNFAVEKGLLAAGADDAEAEGSPVLAGRALERLEDDRGRIVHPRQWYLGYCRLLRRLDEELSSVGGVRRMNSPSEIATLFDKPRCHARCEAAGIAMPASLLPGRTDFQSVRSGRMDCQSVRHPSDSHSPDGLEIRPTGAGTDGLAIRPTVGATVGSYDELVERMEQAGVGRVFVKLAHGSSASGVVAFEKHGPRQAAITSAELVRSDGELRLYNSRRLRRYTDADDLRDLIDALARERVHVERWLPKAALGHRTSFDLRVVTIAGEPRHLVVRQGRGPMTNLHLGNRRGDPATVLAKLGPEQTAALHATCRSTAALFPDSLHVGLDVLLAPGFRSHALLEANAFGDLLPGILWNGLDTYATEIAAMLRGNSPP